MTGSIFRVANWFYFIWASLAAQIVKQTNKQKRTKLPAIQEIWGPNLGWEESLEEGMGTHSCLATSWTEEPGGLQSQSMGSQRVRHD